eukprot:PITA_27742
MEVVLEDNRLKDFIDQEVPKPTAISAQELAKWKKCVATARRILLEGVRDHIVSSFHRKETLFSMWKTLKDICQNSSDQRKLALKDKLRKIKCEKGDTISMFLNNLTTCRDELGSVGITTVEYDMGEIRRSTKDGSSSMEDEENCALASEQFFYKLSTEEIQEGIRGRIRSGASFHMTSDKILFSTLDEKDLQRFIKMGNDEKYSASRVGTIVFQREHRARITLTDVKYVPGLRKNLVSIAMLEDRDYDVVFSKGNIFLRNITTRQVKQIGSRVKNLYALEVQDA